MLLEILEIVFDLIVEISGVGLVLYGQTTGLTAGCGDPNDDIDSPPGRNLLLDDNRNPARFEVGPGWKNLFQSLRQSLQQCSEEQRTLGMACLGIEKVCHDSGQTQFIRPQVVEDVESTRQVPIEFEFHISRHIQPRGQLVEESLVLLAVGLPCVGQPRGQIGAEALRFHGMKISPVPAEIVNLRVLGELVGGELGLEPLPVERGAAAVAAGTRPAWSARERRMRAFTVFDRGRFRPGMAFDGPAIVEEAPATTIVDEGGTVEVDTYGSLVIALDLEDAP